MGLVTRYGLPAVRQELPSFVVSLDRRREIFLALCHACRYGGLAEWANAIQVGDAVEYDVLGDLPNECARHDVEVALAHRGLRWEERFLDDEPARVWVVANAAEPQL